MPLGGAAGADLPAAHPWSQHALPMGAPHDNHDHARLPGDRLQAVAEHPAVVLVQIGDADGSVAGWQFFGGGTYTSTSWGGPWLAMLVVGYDATGG